MIKFNINIKDARLVTKIVQRAERMARENEIEFDFQSMSMDLIACHANGCPIDFEKLAMAPDSDFGHDVWGIRKYIDRTTGQLTQCFVPRCAKPEPAATR